MNEQWTPQSRNFRDELGAKQDNLQSILTRQDLGSSEPMVSNHLTRIRLSRFRNFKELDIEFKGGLNAIIGPNAIGKTTLLEAIHFLSIGRSFRTAKLQEVIKKGESSFTIEAFFTKEGVDQTLSIFYDGTNKEIKHNETLYSSFTPLFGLFPSVVYSPFDIALIHAQPLERRKFLNILIAQSNSIYVHHLTRYAKAVLNRNALLKSKKLATIEIWEEEMIKAAAFIQEKRAEVLDKISLKAKEYYKELSSEKEEVKLVYRASKISTSLLAGSRDRDLILGYTSLGPQRDDIEITLDSLSAKNYASEGQKRTIIGALKLAEKEYLNPSILLIDDFGVHLDSTRKAKFEKSISTEFQAFLTSPYSLEGSTQAFLHFLDNPSPLDLLIPQ
jgi:DNA replication and repair protein RecF